MLSGELAAGLAQLTHGTSPQAQELNAAFLRFRKVFALL